jgi:Ca2+-binding RTX toxin-like protein
MSRRTTVGAGISLGALMAVPASAQAEDIKVTNLNDDGAGSLRAALEVANLDPDSDRILFRSKLSGNVSLSEPLSIDQPLEIRGPGARRVTLDGRDDHRVISGNVGPGVEIAISGLTIANGSQMSGAGIASGGDLVLSNVAITGNYSFTGAGIDADGDVTIERSTISDNRTIDAGAGIRTFDPDISIRNSTISGNTAGGDGGGVYLPAGTTSENAEILNSTITDNQAGGEGGGVYEDGSGATIRGSIIAGNTAAAYDDLEGGPWAVSFSIVGTDGPTVIDPDEGGNLLNVDPKLKPLRNNGGPTDTHAFKNSPAKNKVPKSESEKKDQRGAKRKGKGDIGAYELVKCEGVIVNRVGTGKKDKLNGTKRKDGILGLGGNDVLKGKKGKDGLCGGKGKDELKGGPGKDKLDGGPGKDKEVQ